MHGPSPSEPHPMAGFPQIGFLKPLIKNPDIVVGEYSYYDDPEGPEHFEAKCVLYHFPFIGNKLFIGKFCAVGITTRRLQSRSEEQRTLNLVSQVFIFVECRPSRLH
jgi:virginiamycin A acetyltransferase